MKTIEVMKGLIGKTLVEAKETPKGIFLKFSDGTVLWWQR